MSGNPCRVNVELVPRIREPNEPPQRIRVMLYVGRMERGSGMPMGDFESAEQAGTVATFLLDAVNRAYIAGIEDSHERALAALTKFERKE